MKLTKSQLKQIIKEEVVKLLSEGGRWRGDPRTDPGSPEDEREWVRTTDEEARGLAGPASQQQQLENLRIAAFQAGRLGAEPEFPDNEIYMRSYENGREHMYKPGEEPPRWPYLKENK